jgi:hypothetical protein
MGKRLGYSMRDSARFVSDDGGAGVVMGTPFVGELSRQVGPVAGNARDSGQKILFKVLFDVFL